MSRFTIRELLGHPAIIVVAIVLVAVAPMLYVLSVGPVAWLQANGCASHDAGRTIYRPIRWLMLRDARFHDLMLWYVSLWIPNDKVLMPPAPF